MALTKIDDRGLKTPVDLLDNEKIRFGTGNDLEIYHDGTNTYLDNHVGVLYLRGDGDNITLQAVDGENALIAKPNGSVELYHNDVKKFYTDSTGCHFPDSTFMPDGHYAHFGDGNDLYIGHDGSHSYIQNGGVGSLYIRSNNAIAFLDDSGDEMLAKFIDNGTCELYYDNSKKLETTSAGVTITGSQSKIVGDLRFDNSTTADKDIYWDESEDRLNFFDSVKATFGNSDDLQIYHDGSNSYIDNAATGDLFVRSTQDNGDVNIVCSATNGGFIVKSTTPETMINATANGSVELYYDNVKKLETASGGITVTGMVLADQLAVLDSEKATFGDSNDIQIWHDGTNSTIKNITGYLVVESDNGNLYLDGNPDTYIRVGSNGGEENAVVSKVNGAVELYFDNSKKFETGADGAKLTGYLFAHSNISDSAYTTQNRHVLQSDTGSNAALAVEHSHDSNPYGIVVYFSDVTPDDNTHYFFHCSDSTGSKLKIYSDGDVVNHDNAYGSISDVKLKENIVDAGSQWNDVKAVKVRNFNFKSDTPSDKRLGVVAQELETVSPGLVTTSPDLDIDNNDLGTTTKSVKYSILYMKAFKALQEAMAKIETLETKVAALEGG